MLIRVRLKLSSFICESVDSIVVHSLSHRSKHRKMLFISVCDAVDWPIYQRGLDRFNPPDQSEVAVLILLLTGL